MQQVKIENVVRSYNGRTGCACGCLGAYSLKSADDIGAANKASGWDAHDDRNVRPRAVAVAVRKCNEAIEEFGALAEPDQGGVTYRKSGVWFHSCSQYVSIDRNGRTSTVYFSL